MNIGDIIKDMRERSGLTQKALADRLGVQQSLIAQYERGSKVPTLIMAKKMSIIFGCSVDALCA